MSNFVTLEDYIVHDDNNLKGFRGEAEFLSNFYPCKVWYKGLLYNSCENAYQAAKVIEAERLEFTTCTPAKSKRLWKDCSKLYSAEKWDSIRYDIMAAIVFDKFYRNLDLRKKLINTGQKHLEELNVWHDLWWGVDYKTGAGENKLGKILMKVRKFWIE